MTQQSNDHEMMRLCPPDCCDWDRPVERDQSPTMFHRECKQVDIGELLRAKDVIVVYAFPIE
jgi:hypothetical protein